MFKMICLFTTFFTTFFTVFSAENGLRGSKVTTLDVNVDEVEVWSQFTNFQERFSKKYESISELEERFQIFRTNFKQIITHNLDFTQNFTMGVNQFTDLSPDEFKKQYVGGLRTEVGSYGCKTFSSGASGAPASVDWRNKAAVTSVKDQGQCGSCWTFSATGAIEGAWAIANSQLVDLSEQELVDCATGISYGSHGCDGGEMEGAFKYVIEKGQCALSSYPYTSGVSKTGGACQKCSSVVVISSCSDVKPNDQVSLKAAVAQQPVAIAIEADTRYFQSYASGILTSASCGTNLDHGVLAVGYGTWTDGTDYYKVKNSWGTSWGTNGYILIQRGNPQRCGECGILCGPPSYPNL